MRQTVLVRATRCAALVVVGFGPAFAQENAAAREGLYAGRFDPDRYERMDDEQDPKKAPPYDYSKMGYEQILKVCAEAGLTVEG